MQLRNGKKYTSVTFEEFKVISQSITDVADLSLHTSYKLFKYINSEFPQMYHKIANTDNKIANTGYNKGRNLYVVAAYQKSSELITTLLKQTYFHETKFTDLHKQRIVITIYQLHQTQIIMRQLIRDNIIQDKHVKDAMRRLLTANEIDESKFEVKLYRCLMHIYNKNTVARHGWFEKYKKTGDYSDVETYDLFYSSNGCVESDNYISIYNKCFIQEIENVDKLYWM
jgi:hypothetical protein